MYRAGILMHFCSRERFSSFQAGLGIPENWYFRLKYVKTGVYPLFLQNILTCNSPSPWHKSGFDKQWIYFPYKYYMYMYIVKKSHSDCNYVA